MGVAVFALWSYSEPDQSYQVLLADKIPPEGKVQGVHLFKSGAFDQICFEPTTEKRILSSLGGDARFQRLYSGDRSTHAFHYLFFVGEQGARYAAVAALHVEFAAVGIASECWFIRNAAFERRPLSAISAGPPKRSRHASLGIEELFVWVTLN